MNDAHWALRNLWVNASGDVRAVNMNETTVVPEWADTSVLGVSLMGTAEGRRILWFQRVDFSVVHLDGQGRLIPDAQTQRVAAAIVDRILVPHLSTSQCLIAAVSVPTPLQQKALMKTLVKRWPEAMNRPISQDSWWQAINAKPAHIRGVRRPRVPFHSKP